jgi:hypothetical protein
MAPQELRDLPQNNIPVGRVFSHWEKLHERLRSTRYWLRAERRRSPVTGTLFLILPPRSWRQNFGRYTETFNIFTQYERTIQTTRSLSTLMGWIY